jgi:hypothetical protein
VARRLGLSERRPVAAHGIDPDPGIGNGVLNNVLKISSYHNDITRKKPNF